MLRGEGRPARVTTPVLASVDLGGTQIRVAVSDLEGRLISTRRTSTPALGGPEPAMSWAAQAIAGIAAGGEVVCVAVGAPGPIDQAHGVLVNPPNLPRWHRVPLVELLGSRLRCRVVLENDANLAAVGEHARGAGMGSRHMVYVTWSTGVGGGIIIDGQLWSGAHGAAGEIGHMIIDPDGPLDSCGQRGCVEVFCGGRSLSRQAKEPTPDLFRSAAAGEKSALALVTSAARHMGIALINLSNLLDPELIVIGGGVTRSWGVVAPVLKATLKSSPFIRPARRPRVLRARLGDDGGLLGGLEWARRHQ